MARMPQVDQGITFIYIKDLERSQNFYEGLLGFRLVLDQGTCRIVDTGCGEGSFLGYCVNPARDPSPDGVIMTLVSDQVDNWYRVLKDSGVPVEGEPAINEEYGIYHFFFQDPDGYHWEIQRFLGREWTEGISRLGC
jgi:catechol 2,3-dioxygenase-like lactoylglutathione lyase family enzyme